MITTERNNNLKVALVHDWLPFMGGAENVLSNLLEIFPDAPIYTTICNREKLEGNLKTAKIYTTHLQKGRKIIKSHRKLFPFMMSAMESFDLNEYDIVISSSTSVGKCVITNPSTLHISYCNTPMRYVWEFMHDYIGPYQERPSLKYRLISSFFSFVRVWDYASAARVDVFVANSVNVAKRIKKHYRRDAYVVHPPVKIKRFNISDIDDDYFLCVSRLQEYKRIDLAVIVCTNLNIPLIVIGDGPQRKYLQSIAGPTVKFLGRVSNEIINEHYSKCRALIFPGEEDFGITPLEAQASGRPVIAYGKGGVLETVVEGKTGIFFNEQTAESLASSITKFREMNFNKHILREHAMKFDEYVFKNKINSFVLERLNEFLANENNGITII